MSIGSSQKQICHTVNLHGLQLWYDSNIDVIMASVQLPHDRSLVVTDQYLKKKKEKEKNMFSSRTT